MYMYIICENHLNNNFFNIKKNCNLIPGVMRMSYIHFFLYFLVEQSDNAMSDVSILYAMQALNLNLSKSIYNSSIFTSYD